jgi:hypothetical protein
MLIAKYRKCCFVVLRIDQDVAITDSLFELRTLIERTAATECVNIAVRFTPNSMLRSAAMTGLVLSAASIRSCGGTLAIIDPSPGIRALLDVLGVENLVATVQSEEELAFLVPARQAVA